eukprot:9163323-Lingulodinium_polyedra.AAC.1
MNHVRFSMLQSSACQHAHPLGMASATGRQAFHTGGALPTRRALHTQDRVVERITARIAERLRCSCTARSPRSQGRMQ